MDKNRPRVQFSLRFDNYVGLLERVKDYCQANRISLTEFTATALHNALEMGLNSLPSQLTSNDKFKQLEQSSRDKIEALEQSSHDKINQLEQSSRDKIEALETKIVALESNLAMTSQRLENVDQRLGKLRLRQAR